MRAALVVLLVLLAGGVAHAYPQFQLSRDQTCTGCHLSPSGGGLLSENGYSTAEMVSQLGQAPELFYGKVPTPDWLALGGDLRGAGGFIQTPERVLAAFPMQLDLYARATFGNFAVHVTGGYRRAQEDGSYPVPLWSREHYIQWQQNAGETTGLYVRVGRFMPIFGLRFAEHPSYVRRNGGTQLYSDTYGVNVSYIDPKFEAHASGFIEDPLIDSVEHRNGGALYGEFRATETLQLGAGGMYEMTDFDKKIRIAATGKLYLPGPDILLQLEAQFVNQLVDETATNPAGGAPKQLLGNLVATKMLNDFLMLDVGIGHFDSNLRIKDLDRDAIDVNLHYFLTSHVELLLNARFEMMAFGNGGDPGAYALGQLHYRL